MSRAEYADGTVKKSNCHMSALS